jgi:hypothetical protein
VADLADSPERQVVAPRCVLARIGLVWHA